MADTSRFPHTAGDTGTGRGSPPRMPRWVKISAIVAAILIALFATVRLTGIGGGHGPERHAPGRQREQQQGHDPSRWNHR